MITEINKAFRHILFIEDGHKYINLETGERLISVTTEKKKYLQPFDENLVNVKAEKLGISPFELQAQWDQLAMEGKGRGSLMHSYCQSKSDRKEAKLDTSLYPHMDNLKNQVDCFFRDYNHWITIGNEIVIASDRLGGQIDRLVDEEGRVGIVDYKFQKAFKDSYGKYMKAPFSHVPQTTLAEYTLQLNMYRIIMEQAGFPIDFMTLVHFSTEDTQYKTYDIQKVEIPI